MEEEEMAMHSKKLISLINNLYRETKIPNLNQNLAPNEIVADYMMDKKPAYFWFQLTIFNNEWWNVHDIRYNSKHKVFDLVIAYGLMNSAFEEILMDGKTCYANCNKNEPVALSPSVWNSLRNMVVDEQEEVELIVRYDNTSTQVKRYMLGIRNIKVPYLGVDGKVLLLMNPREPKELRSQLYKVIDAVRNYNERENVENVEDPYVDINELLLDVETGHRLLGSYYHLYKIHKRGSKELIDLFVWWNNIFTGSRFLIPINIEENNGEENIGLGQEEKHNDDNGEWESI